ncbi:MAG TPA: alcohol dehydrogenase [Elusimicrobia bacterium]|nr:alcohol dehydrogenase [Elusimicrobiota bacterium]
MKALLCLGHGSVRLKDIPVPALGRGEALVAPEVCGLCGSDLLKLVPGGHSKPGPLGHEVAGRIAALGPGVRGFKLGGRVVVAHHVPCRGCHYCRRGSISMCRGFKQTNLDPGGFAEFVRVSARHVRHTMLPIPAGLGFAEASLCEPIACCLRDLRRLQPRAGDTVVVVGLGFIGLIMARLLMRVGAVPVGLELDPSRLRLARRLGVRRVFPGWGPAAARAVQSLSEGRGADTVLFTAGPPSLAGECFSWLRDGGTVNLFASFPLNDHFARLDLNQVYHRELTVLTGYSAEPCDLREALRLLSRGEIDPKPFVRWRYPLSRFDEALRLFRSRKILKAVFLPQAGARR